MRCTTLAHSVRGCIDDLSCDVFIHEQQNRKGKSKGCTCSYHGSFGSKSCRLEFQLTVKLCQCFNCICELEKKYCKRTGIKTEKEKERIRKSSIEKERMREKERKNEKEFESAKVRNA